MAKTEWYDPISGRILTKDHDIHYHYSTGTWPYGAEPLNSYSGTWIPSIYGMRCSNCGHVHKVTGIQTYCPRCNSKNL